MGEQSIPRAIRLMNTLFLALEQRGWPVDILPRMTAQVYERDRVRCTILGEEFGFSLREKMRMIPVPQEQRRGIFDRCVRYEPTGLFELSISGQYGHAVDTWRDGKKSRVEDRLNDVVVGLIVAVERNRERREEARRQEPQRLVAEQERRERDRLEELERARVSGLESLAGRWEKASRLRVFIDAVREEASRRQVAIDAEDGFARWLEWAEQHVRAMDSLATDARCRLTESLVCRGCGMRTSHQEWCPDRVFMFPRSPQDWSPEDDLVYSDRVHLIILIGDFGS